MMLYGACHTFIEAWQLNWYSGAYLMVPFITVYCTTNSGSIKAKEGMLSQQRWAQTTLPVVYLHLLTTFTQ